MAIIARKKLLTSVCFVIFVHQIALRASPRVLRISPRSSYLWGRNPLLPKHIRPSELPKSRVCPVITKKRIARCSWRMSYRQAFSTNEASHVSHGYGLQEERCNASDINVTVHIPPGEEYITGLRPLVSYTSLSNNHSWDMVNCFVSLGLVSLHVGAALAARQPYDVRKIIKAFREPHDDLTILCAHRGLR